MKKNKKIAVASILALSLVFPFSAWAYVVGSFPYIGTVSINVNEILQEVNESGLSSVTGQLEDRYGIDQDIWRKGKRKESAPRTELFFDNTNPKPGEKVTARAVPEFFKNDPQNLYYTWYIIHTRDGKSETATNGLSDGKIEAAKLMTRGDYDPNLDGQTYDDPSRDPDSDGWPAIDNSYDENKTAAPMGGADGVGGLPQETVESFSSATEWCDSLGDHTQDKCLYNDGDTFKPLVSYFTLNSSQTNHYCDLCKDYFSGGGAAAYTSAQTARNDCCYTNTPEASLQCSSTTQVIDPITGEITDVTTYFKCPQDSSIDYCGTTYNSLFDSCYENFKESNKSTVSTCLNAEYSSCRTDWATIHEDEDGDGFSDLNEEDTTQVSRCYKHNFGTNFDASIFRENTLADSALDDSSGLDFSTPCKHKWSNADKSVCTADDCTSGSGKFPTGEEEYWKTDPIDPDTDGDGFPDEADVIGLGQDNFTWNYQPGDRVGVVVEGTSMIPVDEKSAYFKIMWGYLDVCDSTKVGLLDRDQCEDSSDYGYGFLTTKSPSEQGDDKLKISLSFSPDSILADPSSANTENIASDGTISDADEIYITSSLDTTNYNPKDLYYTWQISKGDPQKDDWTEIKDIANNFNTTSASSGMGVDQFSFTPKKDVLSGEGNIIYFKVTLTVNKASDLTAGRGRSSVIVPVNKKGIKISLHKVDIVDGKAVVGDEICNNGLYKNLCPVVKGQMLAAQVSGSNYGASDSEFLWKMNGNPIYPPSNASQLFEGWDKTTIFFPITKEEQELENLSVVATSKDQLQPITGTRLATIVHPAVFIKSSDTSMSWPKVYTAEDPDRPLSSYEVESRDAFESFPLSNASYSLDFVPYYLIGEDSNSIIDWLVNGTSVYSPDFYTNNPSLETFELQDNDRTIVLPTGEIEGSFTNLSAQVKKYWSEEERNISYSAWGIAPNTLSGDFSVSIETTSAINEDTASAANGTSQILAAIGTHLPHYFMYLLRLALTMAVMFIVSVGFYGLSQRLNFADDEK